MPNLSRESLPRLKRLLPKLKGQRIGVMGDLMLDRFLWGTASRLSPEAAVPVVDFAAQTECLGGAGNVAVNLASLGARVEAFGLLGEDEAGRALRACLRVAGIADRGAVADKSRVTTVKTRVIARHQQIVRIDREKRDSVAPALEEKLFRRLLSTLRNFDGFVLSDYDKGLVTDGFAERVLSACHRLDVPVF